MQLAVTLLRQIDVNDIFSKNGEKERKTEYEEAMDEVYYRPGALSALLVLGQVMVGTPCRTIHL